MRLPWTGRGSDPSAATSVPGVAPDADVAARVGGVLFAVGGLVAFLVVLAPHPPQVNVTGFVVVGIMAELGGLALYLLAGRISKRTIQIAIAIGAVLVTSCIAMSGESRGASVSDNEMLYVWVALFAAYFFTVRQALTLVAWAAVCYAATLWFYSPHDIIVTRWIETVFTLGIATMLIVLLKRRVQGLLSRLADAARTDPLTDLHNRRGFEESIEVEIERARRGDHSLTLLVADLDHFKRVNDRLGHAAGDAALTEIGRILRQGKRQIDYAARTGGEEFALILPETTEEEAYGVAERLRAAVARVLRGRAGAAHVLLRHRRLSAPWRDARRSAARRGPGALRGQGARPQPDRHLLGRDRVDRHARRRQRRRRDAPGHPAVARRGAGPARRRHG